MSREPATVRQVFARVRHQLGARAEQRVRTVRSRQETLQLTEATQRRALRHGYLVSRTGSPTPTLVAGWHRREMGTFTYHLHPSTRITVAGFAAAEPVVLLGDPVDVDADTADAWIITERLAGLVAAGTDAIVRAASQLGGRWTLFMHGPDGALIVLTDALASQDVWWDGDVKDGAVIASHPALLANPSASLLRPNTLLRVGPHGGSDAEVRRYWPAPADSVEGPPGDVDAVCREIRERLLTHTRLLSTLGTPGVALTEGLASRALLAAYLQHPREDGFTFTTFEVSSVREGLGQVENLFAASHLAQTVGLAHRVVEVAPSPEGRAIALAYAQTYPEGTRAGVAWAYEALPEGTVVLHPAGVNVLDRATWEDGDHLGVIEGFPEGDLTHRVLLPFNDRRSIELLLSLPPTGEDTPAPVTQLAHELPPLTPGLDA